jgi:23S rRNA pseudouridine1911/1915/1917 synthase
MVLKYSVGEQDNENGRKVYSIMRRELRISAALTRRLKQAGAIFVEGEPAYTDRLVVTGESVEIDITAAEPPCDVVPEQGDMEVLYENDGLLAVNKASGIIVHPSRAKYTGTLANYVAGYLQRASGDGRCHAVNRLDRDTSGVVLFAKNSYMKALASEALAAPEAKKEYMALVLGSVEEPQGTIDQPIKRFREGDMLRVAAPDGQRAVTHYETVQKARAGGYEISLLRLRLETGRTHQIRVHCQHLGHPVLGDILYYSAQSRAVSEALGIYTQALHAYKLTFIDPLTGALIELQATLPQVFSISQGQIPNSSCSAKRTEKQGKG